MSNLQGVDRFIANAEKQIRFATAAALTATAKDAQKAVVSDILETFTVRSKWYLQSSEYGIKVKSADKREDPPFAEVHTAADWLVLHETGGTKTAQGGGLLAVPQNVVSSRAAKITARLRPRALEKAFVLKTKSGPALFQRLKRNSAKVTGPDKRLKLLYTLEESVRVPKQPVFGPTVKEVANAKFPENLTKWLEKAFQTANP